MKKRDVCLTVTVLCVLLMLVYEILGYGRIFGEHVDKEIGALIDMTVTRALGAIAFVAVIINLEYNVLRSFGGGVRRSLLFALPAFAVVINNLPIIPLVSGAAYVSAPAWKIILLLAQCFAVGAFEETAFRGVVLLSFAEKRRDSVKGLFWSVILSSAVFGAVHLLNLFTSSPVAVLMQIGYSFLIGAMCSVVLLKTGDLWLCIILHTLFNFCGALVPTCGGGVIWDAPTVILTVTVALAVTLYMTVAFFRLRREDTDGIYLRKTPAPSDGEDALSEQE